MGTVFAIREALRQELTGDNKFFKNFVNFFELRVPAEVSYLGFTTFLFPLMVNPESYEMDEPFTMEVTPTQGGGLVVEENGINQRMIRIRGTTGFMARPLTGGKKYLSATLVLDTLSPEQKSYTRRLNPYVIDKLSGQRHFQYLQDAVFRTYADLKRDPALSKDTKLIFHNPKDDEHWLVAPQNFKLTRNAARRVLYDYSIDLLVLDKAEAVDADFSEDLSLLDKIRNAISEVKEAIAMVTGAIQDLVALVGDIKAAVQGLISIIDSCVAIIDAVDDFIEGVVDLVKTPINQVKELKNTIEESFANFGIDDGEYVNLDALVDSRGMMNVLHTANMLIEGLDRLTVHPEIFETPSQTRMREIRDQQSAKTQLSTTAFEDATADSSPTSLRESSNIGTFMTPGEAYMADSLVGAGRNINVYTGAKEHTISQGETLVNLAATHLGDARLWQHIAVINGLQPPFIDNMASSDLSSVDESPLPGSVGVGKKILIPNYVKPTDKLPLLPVIGVAQEKNAEEHVLGTDLALEPVVEDRGFYDIPVNIEQGSVDAKVVKGRNNIKQTLQLRLRTEKGTDTLYKKVGLQKVVSLGITPSGLDLAKFYILETLNVDQRIASVKQISVEQQEDPLDTIETDAEVEIRGFTEGVKVKLEIE